MNEKTRQFNNEVNQQITRLEKAQKRDEEILKNLHTLNLPEKVYNNKKSEIESNIERRNLEIYDLKNGKKELVIIQNPKVVKAAKPVKKAKPQPKKISNTEVYKEKKDLNYSERVFYKIVSTIPDYMLENLKDMPNNKGYIWRGCWLFGLQPADKYDNYTVLFEKLRGGVTKIHEFDKHNYNIYEKVGKERKTLISTQPRRKIAQLRF